MGTGTGMLRSHWLQGQVIAGDNSDQESKMGAGYNDLRRKKKRSSEKWDKRRRALTHISLNSQRLY